MSDFALRQAHRKTVDAIYLVVDESTSGDHTMVAGVAGSTIVVYSIFVITGADNTVLWKSGSTTILGGSPLATNGGYHVESDFGISETVDGEDLILNTSAVAQIGGGITYALVKIPT